MKQCKTSGPTKHYDSPLLANANGGMVTQIDCWFDVKTFKSIAKRPSYEVSGSDYALKGSCG